jgi:HEPN domain-containing protein
MMKDTITHLPANKQNDIKEILQIIMEEANPERVILFGSHATNNWVEDEYKEGGIKFSYISDYDFLVVISNDDKKEQVIISSIENRTNHYKNAVSIIVHRDDYINEGLSIGQYFFTEIANEGISLFDSGKSVFVPAKELTPEQEKQKAENYFDLWFPKGASYLKGANFYLNEKELSTGVFLLHQAAECFYSAVLLVFLGYKPKTHNLNKLRNYSKHISHELYSVFRTPILDENEYHLFALLKRAYIDARYKLDYNIKEKEVKILIDKITKIQIIVKEICKAKIDELSAKK